MTSTGERPHTSVHENERRTEIYCNHRGVDLRAVYYLAVVYSLTGEKDLAFQQLEKSRRIPIGITYDDLLFEPFWDNLRGDPRFPKLVESMKPKD